MVHIKLVLRVVRVQPFLLGYAFRYHFLKLIALPSKGGFDNPLYPPSKGDIFLEVLARDCGVELVDKHII